MIIINSRGGAKRIHERINADLIKLVHLSVTLIVFEDQQVFITNHSKRV